MWDGAPELDKINEFRDGTCSTPVEMKILRLLPNKTAGAHSTSLKMPLTPAGRRCFNNVKEFIMAYPKHIIVTSCLVRNPEGSILCVKHHRRGWELPQGKVDEGEALLDALQREVLEESGITIAAPVLAAVWSKLSEPVALIHGFVAEYVGGTPMPSDETPEVAWLSEDEACERVIHPVNRDRLADLLAFDGSVRFHRYTTEPYSRNG